jgi:release factor glutamine methyltransferase
MQLGALYANAKTQLNDVGNPSPALDARLLICHALKMTHEQFILKKDMDLSEQEEKEIVALIAQRLHGRPVAKIIGSKEFYGREFKTTDETLDPRPDSETLIDAVLETIADKNASIRILDLGTGTGCLALTLISELSNASAVAVDQSEAALAVADHNAHHLNVKQRVEFLKSDWLSAVTGQFDMIISNPPYIPESDIPGLEKEVRIFDPMAALTGGEDGLDPYRIIIPQLAAFLKPQGIVAFELGRGQAGDVAALLTAAGFKTVYSRADLSGIDRVVVGIQLQNPVEQIR